MLNNFEIINYEHIVILYINWHVKEKRRKELVVSVK